MQRLWLAFRSFWLVLIDRDTTERVRIALAPPKIVAPPPEPMPLGAVKLLGLLQREGRLIDFLNENIDGYGDDQVGAAVRDIHRGCRKVLDETMQLKPIIEQEEESRLEVPVGFDPAQIRLTGNVHGDPPFQGTLKHHGWVVRSIKFPGAVDDSRVIAPAEVEV